ncbi:hypothetical protein DPMN_175797 [Dreissena polymorpha]|uniref:Uncharacterized protein n=1 Tax=Dreissena polymorpha TaxID=45954 RepID=A0A9D4E8H4_DREPO|nr:hypothetical protein DPMN_175797 [Dreissena polymorpha]
MCTGQVAQLEKQIEEAESSARPMALEAQSWKDNYENIQTLESQSCALCISSMTFDQFSRFLKRELQMTLEEYVGENFND